MSIDEHMLIARPIVLVAVAAVVVGVAALVLVIIAAIKSNEGTAYRYPFCWRLIK